MQMARMESVVVTGRLVLHQEGRDLEVRHRPCKSGASVQARQPLPTNRLRRLFTFTSNVRLYIGLPFSGIATACGDGERTNWVRPSGCEEECAPVRLTPTVNSHLVSPPHADKKQEVGAQC